MGILKPHRPSDYPSLLLYILDETHITITLLTALAILYTKDAHVVWFAIGALNSSLSAKLLKNLIRNPRPTSKTITTKTTIPKSSSSSFEKEKENKKNLKSSSSLKTYKIKNKKTYGMPSTHSTSLTFYFIYLIPFLINKNLNSNFQFFRNLLSILGISIYWLLGLWSRKKLGYHNLKQIFGGILFGSFLAFIWKFIYLKFPFIGLNIQNFINIVWNRIFG
ncbi:uncharacterized protein I206_101040 [Kwoniella pini CBS 10737]|uniref:Phosphatidic acid phosphatase type 2/haloperoxidase domain-containing protein n=1 Tax=Kwoniella pini CBS 10737 TaxID=1296096 RepID=A0A1B9IBF8_9TREE|nr:uncharacterized protein I206_00286 [Kwoniella pini CBS 10737]OCF52985.1 hypothetical protein I206_00286 [Kwoniella pini CBS 10737]